MKRFALYTACLILATACADGSRKSPADAKAKQVEKKLDDVAPQTTVDPKAKEDGKTQENGKQPPTMIEVGILREPKQACKKEDAKELKTLTAEIVKSDYTKLTREVEFAGKAMPNKVSATRHLQTAKTQAEASIEKCREYEKTVDVKKCEIADVKLAAEKLANTCVRLEQTKKKIDSKIASLK